MEKKNFIKIVYISFILTDFVLYNAHNIVKETNVNNPYKYVFIGTVYSKQ